MNLKLIMLVIAGSIFTIASHAQFFKTNTEVTVNSTMPTQPNSQQDSLGSIQPGSVFEVLEAQSKAVKIKLWLLKNGSKLRETNSMWIFKDDSLPETAKDFVEIQPARKQADPAPSVEARSSADNCTDGNCGANTVSAQTPAAVDNTSDLRAVANTALALKKPTAAAVDSALENQIKNFSESEEVKTAIAYGLSNKRGRSTGKCYRAVKMALAASPRGTKRSGLIPGHFSDVAAVQGKESLKDFGFINLLEKKPFDSTLKNNPSAAPKGSVLVYSSGLRCKNTTIKDCGHIEIKTKGPGESGYVSDYYSDDPISETVRHRSLKKPIYKLVGIMIKPMDKK